MPSQLPPCKGPLNRRAFLQAGFLGLSGMGLSDLLRARAASGTNRQTSVILVWLVGGQSHLESYDMKPDAPAEIRGAFKPIRTKVPGLDICEHLPRQARIADKFALIRSVHHGFPGHTDGAQRFLTGREPRGVNPLTVDSDHPDIGCVYKSLTPPRQDGMPSYVAVRHDLYYVGPSYLGRKNAAFLVPPNYHNPREYDVPNLALTSRTAGTFHDRVVLQQGFDAIRRDLDNSGTLEAMDAHAREATRVLTSPATRRAFDLNSIDPRMRDRYGRTVFGQGLLMARQLIEAGVGFVSVDGGWFADVHPSLQDNWDDHETNRNIFEAMKRRFLPYDLALTALIEDIYERGLDRDVLLVVTGEFGRTPKIYYDKGTPGRGHHPGAMSILLSGGGMRMGQVIGGTDAKGESAHNRLLNPEDLLATIYNHLGVDTRRELRDLSGRPIPILPRGDVIRELHA